MVHWFTCCALRQLLMNEDWLHSRRYNNSGDTTFRAPVGSTVVILRRLARKASLRRIIARFPTCLSMPVIEKGQEAPRGQGGRGKRGGQARPRRKPGRGPGEARQGEESHKSQERGRRGGGEAREGEARKGQERGQGGSYHETTSILNYYGHVQSERL